MVMVRPKQSEMLVTAAGCRPFRLNITHYVGGFVKNRERIRNQMIVHAVHRVKCHSTSLADHSIISPSA